MVRDTQRPETGTSPLGHAEHAVPTPSHASSEAPQVSDLSRTAVEDSKGYLRNYLHRTRSA
jgi:hypothetical protein